MTAPTRVVVVGASRGLGRCICVGLAQRGSQVALLVRRGEGSIYVPMQVG